MKFNKGMMKIDPNDRFREAKINALEVKTEDFNAVELIKMQETKSKKRESINPIWVGGSYFTPAVGFPLITQKW